MAWHPVVEFFACIFVVAAAIVVQGLLQDVVSAAADLQCHVCACLPRMRALCRTCILTGVVLISAHGTTLSHEFPTLRAGSGLQPLQHARLVPEVASTSCLETLCDSKRQHRDV
jgi:hypothetical protein